MGTNIKKRLFLGNLPDGINDKDIRSRFSKFGQVNSVDIKVKKVSDARESSTFAFVELSVPSESQLQQCVNKLDGSDISGNAIRVQVAKESFLSRLQAEREQSSKQGNKTYQEKNAAHEERNTTNYKDDRKHQKFESHKNADNAAWKNRQNATKTAAAADYNPLQMLKNHQQKNAVNQEESTQIQIQTSPSKKSWNKKSSNFSTQNDENGTEDFKGGLPKFGGTKSLSSTSKTEEEPKKPSGKGSLMAELENYSGMWNDQDVVPVVVDHQRKRRFDTTEEEQPADSSDTLQQKSFKQKRARGTTRDNYEEKEESPAQITEAAPKHKTISSDEQKKKELDNQKRILSLQQRNDALKAQQNLIKSALKLTNESQNKKKFFFNDEPADAVLEETTQKVQQKPAKQSEKKPKLFDDDDEDVADYADDFKSRPQFDTEQGQELLELQSRFGRDQRFKLDHRFIDHGEEAEPEAERDAEHDEKDRQMAILGSIVPLGPALAQSNDSSKNRIKSKAFVRFDPNAKDHEKFEKVSAPVVKDGQGKKKGKFEPAESAPLPEVSSERFYQTAGPLDIGHSQGFSLRSMFQSSAAADDVDDDEEPIEEANRTEKPETKETQKGAAPVAPQEQQGYWKNAGMWHEQLFFQDNDSRLKEALDFIRNPSKEEPYADRAKWAEFREKLKYFYRNKMRRHTVWAEGPSRQQKKSSQPEQVDETAFQFYGQPDASAKKKKPHRTYYK